MACTLQLSGVGPVVGPVVGGPGVGPRVCPRVGPVVGGPGVGVLLGACWRSSCRLFCCSMAIWEVCF